MPFLAFEDGRRFSLEDEQKLLIGRDARLCGIVLNQPFVSRRQALIECRAPGTYVLVNLSEQGTTLVNGSRVAEHTLRNGDEVSVNNEPQTRFRFLSLDTANSFVGNFSAVDESTTTAGGIRDRVIPQISNSFSGSLSRSSKIRIGRSTDNDYVLEGPGVSRFHAVLEYNDSAFPMIRDLGSTNGTFVNGEPVRSGVKLTPDDWVSLGGFLLRIDGRDIRRQDLSASRLTAVNVTKTYGDRTVLEDVTIPIFPREFVGLMGASGCGKSTLMDALNGMRPATSGQVLVNDLDLYDNFDLLRRSIGYVPQRDILHEELSVERTLYYAGKMRLPKGTSDEQIRVVVNEVIETVGLKEQVRNSFKELSGGQQKRLSLGIELITKPTFLFLDEPTSPLDPETTENMMLLFRRLADEGRIVIMVTHKFEKFNTMHQVVLLTKGGKLAFFGPPNEALRYFECTEPSEIYRRLNQKSPHQANIDFRNSESHRRFVTSRFNQMSMGGATGHLQGAHAHAQTKADRRFGISQWITLTRRFAEIKSKDLKNTCLLLAQAFIVALTLPFITDDVPNDGRTIFISSIIAFWLGANNSVREIIAEKAVYERERLVNLKLPSYIFSKFAVLSVIGLVQCLLFVAILTSFDRFVTGDFWMLTGILYLTLLGGVAIGLFMSALVSSTEKAMSVLPLIIIPQLLLSGFLTPLDDVYVNLRTGKPATVEDYDKSKKEETNSLSPQSAAVAPRPGSTQTAPPIPPPFCSADPIQKSEGLGGISIVANVIPARWTIDALAHEVSIGDKEARDKLATTITVSDHKILGPSESDAELVDDFKKHLLKDCGILSGFVALFLIGTGLALKQKDKL